MPRRRAAAAWPSALAQRRSTKTPTRVQWPLAIRRKQRSIRPSPSGKMRVRFLLSARVLGSVLVTLPSAKARLPWAIAAINSMFRRQRFWVITRSAMLMVRLRLASWPARRHIMLLRLVPILRPMPQVRLPSAADRKRLDPAELPSAAQPAQVPRQA